MLLKIGSSGPEVIALQKALGLTADGDFGPGTEKAVKDFQTKNSLLSDGVVGDNTWNIIQSKSTLPKVNTTLNIKALIGYIPNSVIEQIPSIIEAFDINTPLRLAHFLSQCGHESGGFKFIAENLNYSSTGLTTTFKKYFVNESFAKLYERQPEKIASRVYANRMGNGDEKSRDGWKFRGRGFIQLTGKDNYTKFTQFIGEDCVANPDLVSTKYPLASAAFFFKSNGLLSICDKGSDVATITSVSKRVNGGTIGLEDRIKHFNEYYAKLK